MGVLYEHWRTDLNECFYVGASWQNPESRPYEMDNRHPDHISVQEELSAKGLTPEVRLIECSHLTKSELGELEILQIAYWKDLIGKRLVNIAKGGSGICIDWDDELCDRHSDIMVAFYQTPEGQAAIEKGRQTNTGRKQPPGWSERSLSWKIGNKSRTGMVGTRLGHVTPQETKEKQSVSAVKRMQTDEGKRNVINAGKAGGAASWTNPDSRFKMLLRDWHMSNVRNKPYWGA